jgi:hypothetical protein
LPKSAPNNVHYHDQCRVAPRDSTY